MSKERLAIAEAFLDMTLRPCDAAAHDNPKMREYFLYQILEFPCFALPFSEKPTVICGFFHAFGHCTAWMVTGEGFEASAHRVLPMQRRLCADMYAALPVHVMDIEVHADRADAMRWAVALGFEFETFLQRRGPQGQDIAVFLWPE